MKAIVYTVKGGPDVLRLVERPVPEPGPGEVRVRVVVSGVNPTDWKMRLSADPGAEQVPNQDGAGVIDAVGPGVPDDRIGDRVWLWEAAYRRTGGTAQEFVTLPSRQAVTLPDHASFDLGASVGIPAITAHRCLTVAEAGPERLGDGALFGRTVLVAGGAGAVGNAAIQLAVWAGATVLTTVSSPEKEALARAAGAHHVVDYRQQDAAERMRELAPSGVDIVVEVAPAANAALDLAVVGSDAVVAFYANDAETAAVPVRPSMVANLRWQGVMVYGVPTAAKDHAVAAVSSALFEGALRAGPEAGLPFHRFPLARTAEAHTAVRSGAVGKVLIDVAG